MNTVTRWVHAALLTAGLVAAPAWSAPKIKFEKTEVEKARGKCVGAVLLGGIAGALLGRATGKNNTAEGAIIGAGLGAGACVVIMGNAKRQDRIIAAQIAAAKYQGQEYQTNFMGDDESVTSFSGKAGADQTFESAQLRPVRYMIGDQKMESPILAEGGQPCRMVSSRLENAGNGSALPNQLFCRTAQGDYAPYAVVMANKNKGAASS